MYSMDSKTKGRYLIVIRLFLCVGIFVFGYYVGRQSMLQDSIQDETEWEEQDETEQETEDRGEV